MLTGGEVSARELIRLELARGEEITLLWGQVVYSVHEMGFAVRFLVDRAADQQNLDRLIAKLAQ